MATAYFDNNIFVAIEEDYLNLHQVIQSIDPTIDTVFFSASHLQEAQEIKGKKAERNERINRRIETIAEITKNNYLYEKLSSRQVIAIIEHPRAVFETIQDVSWANWFIKLFVNFISQKKRNEYRQLLDLNPSELNNYKPKDVLDKLNKKLKDHKDGSSVMDMIEQGISYHPDGQSFGLSNRIAGVFEMLDLLGYWKDKHTKKSNYARLWDSNHTFFGAHANYFVSRDKRTRYKAEVVYQYYGIETKIVAV